MGLLEILQDAIDPSGRSVQGFLGNIVSSAGDIGESLVGLGEEVGQDILSVLPGGAPASFQTTGQLATQLPGAIGSHLKENYLDPAAALLPGGVPAGEGAAQFGQYAYERPAELALDVLGVQQLLSPGSVTRRAVGKVGDVLAQPMRRAAFGPGVPGRDFSRVDSDIQLAQQGLYHQQPGIQGLAQSEAGALAIPGGMGLGSGKSAGPLQVPQHLFPHAQALRQAGYDIPVVRGVVDALDGMDDLPDTTQELFALADQIANYERSRTLYSAQHLPMQGGPPMETNVPQRTSPQGVVPLGQASPTGVFPRPRTGFDEPQAITEAFQGADLGQMGRAPRVVGEAEGSTFFPEIDEVVARLERDFNITPDEVNDFIVNFTERSGRSPDMNELTRWAESVASAGATRQPMGTLDAELARIKRVGGDQAYQAELRRRQSDPRYSQGFQANIHEEFWSRPAEVSGAGPAAQAADIGILNEPTPGQPRIPGDEEATVGQEVFGANWRAQARDRYDPLTGETRPAITRPGQTLPERANAAADPMMRGTVNPRLGTKMRVAEAADFLVGPEPSFTPREVGGRYVYGGPEVETFIRNAQRVGIDVAPEVLPDGSVYLTRTQLNSVFKQRRQAQNTIRTNLTNTVARLRREAEGATDTYSKGQLLRQADQAEQALLQMRGGKVALTTKAPGTIAREAKAATTSGISRGERVHRPSPEIQEAISTGNQEGLRALYNKERTSVSGANARLMGFEEWADWQGARMQVSPTEMRSWSPEQYQQWAQTRRSAAMRQGVSPEAAAANYPDTLERYFARQDELSAEYAPPQQVYSQSELEPMARRVSTSPTRRRSVVERRRQEQRGRTAAKTAKREGITAERPRGDKPLPVAEPVDRRALADVEAPSSYLNEEVVPLEEIETMLSGADEVAAVGDVRPEMVERIVAQIEQRLDAGQELDEVEAMMMRAIEKGQFTDAEATAALSRIDEAGEEDFFSAPAAAEPVSAPVEERRFTTETPTNPTRTTPAQYSATPEEVRAEFVRQAKEYFAGKRDREPSPKSVAEGLSGQSMTRRGKGSTLDPARKQFIDQIIRQVFTELGGIQGVRKLAGQGPTGRRRGAKSSKRRRS